MMMQVLVCDDEAHIMHAVAYKLRSGGFDVVQAHNGQEAIEWLESHTPDLVVTDYQMPFVDGLALCRYLRERPQSAQVPIIMLTAKALELSEDLVKREWGVEAILMKPFSPRGLLELVKRTIEVRALSAAS